MSEAAPQDAPRKPSAILGLIKAFAVLAALVTVQVVAAAALLPSASKTEELAHDLIAAKKGEADGPGAEGEAGGHGEAGKEGGSGEHAEGGEGEHDELVEVRLGEFTVTRFNAKAETTMNVDFEVWATISHSEDKEFEELFEKNRNRIKEQISLTVHAADAAELRDRGLGLLKRRILEKTNRALGKPLIHELLLTRFNFVEH